MEEPALYDDQIITEPPDDLAGVPGPGPLISVGCSTVLIFAHFFLFGMRSNHYVKPSVEIRIPPASACHI